MHGSAQSLKKVEQIEIKKRIQKLNIDSDEEEKEAPRQEEEEEKVQISSERIDSV